MADHAETLRKRALRPLDPASRRLIVVESPDREALGRTIIPAADGMVLGREGEGEGVISDPRLSRRHARLAVEADAITVTDLGGTNGTYVDGAPVEHASLKSGSVLSLGDTLLVVDTDPDPDHLPVSERAGSTEAFEVVGISRVAEQLRRSLATVARSRGHVLLLGPTGVGKDVAARAIHRVSQRTGPFVPVNCAGIPAELAESEFFGYRKGAFTGADRDKEGVVSRAAGGTLFLDEVGELPLALQAKLLRFLEDGSVRAVGDVQETKVDLRVVAATNANLETSGFRSDLLARLGDWVVRIAPLCERKADVLLLCDHFLRLEGRPERDWTTETAEALLLHDWPANIRELRKLALRLAQLGPEGPLDLHLLPAPLQAPLRSRVLESSKDGSPPTSQLEEAMRESSGNVTAAAERNGWHRTQLYRWLRRAGIDPKDYR